MKNVLIVNDCKYAQDKPSLPILEFIEGETYPLQNYLADSIIRNGDGNEATKQIRVLVQSKVKPETKENPRKSKSSNKQKG